MQFEQYQESVERVAMLVEQEHYQPALEILRNLLASEISDLDKALMCVNMATIYERMERIDEALTWYDRGIDYEQPHFRFVVAEHKAAYLAEKSRVSESMAIYEALLRQPYVTEAEKQRFRHNLNALETQD